MHSTTGFSTLHLSQHLHQSSTHGKRKHMFYWQNCRWFKFDFLVDLEGIFLLVCFCCFLVVVFLSGFLGGVLSLEPVCFLFLWHVWHSSRWVQGRLRLPHRLRDRARVKGRTALPPRGGRWFSGRTMARFLAYWTVELNTFLLGKGPRTEGRGWLWQILVHALHADLKEAMSADRLLQEDPLKLSVDRQGILLALDKCLIIGDKPQVALEVANSRDPLAVASGHLQALPQYHHPLPFLHLHITYQPTHSTRCLNSLLSNQCLMTPVSGMYQSGATSPPFSLLLVERMVEQDMVLDEGILEVYMEVVWPLCSQALRLTLLMMAIITTSHMATHPILWRLHVLPSCHLLMVWTTDTLTVSSMRNLLLPFLPLMPTRPLLW